MQHPPIALQMYTVRDQAALDFMGTFREVAKIGYKAVELAGTGGLSATDLRVALDDIGLQIAGNHAALDKLESNIEAVLDFQEELGCRYVVCPWLPEDRRSSADGYRTVAESLNRAGEAVRARGMQLCYHNHAFEFQRFDGESGLDILFSSTQPQLVHAELDTYWVKYGGDDPVKWLQKLSGRVPLVHLKDMAADESRTFAEVGEGTLDWSAILPACESAGAQWLIVEQDKCQRPSLESAALSFRNLQAMGYS